MQRPSDGWRAARSIERAECSDYNGLGLVTVVLICVSEALHCHAIWSKSFYALKPVHHNNFTPVYNLILLIEWWNPKHEIQKSQNG